jgi:putative tricarboxylic transport membrane protein
MRGKRGERMLTVGRGPGQRPRLLVVLLASVVALAGCGLARGGRITDGVFTPGQTELVVHTGVGGGSDLFAREAVTILQDEQLITTNWPVRNVTEGDGIGAMSYLLGRPGDTDTIAAMTPTWLVTPLTVEGESITYEQLQPVAGLVVEPMVVAVPADSPLGSMSDFVQEARRRPGELVQVGGSVTASDLLAGRSIQRQTRTDWKLLSFEDTGQRLTALLRGDADMMIGAPGDFTEQVRAGELKVVTVLGEDRVPGLEDVPTAAEQQLEVADLPQQFRGIMAPPDLPEPALAYYQDVFARLVQTPGWREYTEAGGLVTRYADAAAFGRFLDEQAAALERLIDELDLDSA